MNRTTATIPTTSPSRTIPTLAALLALLFLAAGCGGGDGGDGGDAADRAGDAVSQARNAAQQATDASDPLVQEARQNLPAGDAERGARVYETCAACHALNPTPEEPYFGPHLEGIMGREVAADDRFGYTDAMKELGGVWTEGRLAAYLHAPEQYVPGTEMVQALPDWQDVADVIAYLRAQQ